MYKNINLLVIMFASVIFGVYASDQVTIHAVACGVDGTSRCIRVLVEKNKSVEEQLGLLLKQAHSDLPCFEKLNIEKLQITRSKNCPNDTLLTDQDVLLRMPKGYVSDRFNIEIKKQQQ